MIEENKLQKPALLTTKQQAFLELWAKNKFTKDTMVWCAIQAGYTPTSARSIVSSFLNSEHSPMRMKFLKAMEDADFTLDKTVKEHARIAFEAMHPFRPNMPDNEVRRKGIGMAYDLFDIRPPKRIEFGRAQETEVMLDFNDVNRIEQYTGEKLIDAKVVEEKDEELEPL